MANSVDPDQILLEQSDLGLHCLLKPNCPRMVMPRKMFVLPILWLMLCRIFLFILSYNFAGLE